jgi:hypothetical protein
VRDDILRVVVYFVRDGEGEETQIAEICTRNITEFSDVSDFEYLINSVETKLSEDVTIPAIDKQGVVRDHYRLQNIWQLVGKVIRDALGPPVDR